MKKRFTDEKWFSLSENQRNENVNIIELVIMLHSYTSYCYFLMVKESVVSCAQHVLESLERNSKRYTGKQKPPAKLNKHFFSFKDRFSGCNQRCLCKGHHSGGQTASSLQKKRAIEMSSHSGTRSLQMVHACCSQNAVIQTGPQISCKNP